MYVWVDGEQPNFYITDLTLFNVLLENREIPKGLYIDLS